MQQVTPQTPGESFLYLVEIEGRVKVGISAKPDQRLAQHRRDAAAYGRSVGRTWVSPVPHGNARANEAAIKSGSRREYLARSFDDCLAQACTLPLHRLDPDEVAAKADRTLRMLQGIALGGVR